MSTDYENADAKYVSVDWAPPHGEIGEERLPAGNYAINISGDSVFSIQGLPTEILSVAEKITRAAQRIAEHAARPLALSDFTADQDGYFQCPRCKTHWEPVGSNLGHLVTSITDHFDTHRPSHERE